MVIQFFHHPTERIKRVVWKNREKVFGHLELRNKQLALENSLLNIYSRLRKSFNLDAKKLLDIDISYSKFFKEFDFNIAEEIKECLIHLYSLSPTIEKYKYLCSLTESTALAILPHLPSSFQNYYTVLGPERMRALWYNVTEMKREYEQIIGNQSIDIRSIIITEFKVGEKIPKNIVKEKLKTLYDSIGYSKTPKAVDLGEYFIIKNCKIPRPDGTRDNGYEILKIKEE